MLATSLGQRNKRSLRGRQTLGRKERKNFQLKLHPQRARCTRPKMGARRSSPKPTRRQVTKQESAKPIPSNPPKKTSPTMKNPTRPGKSPSSKPSPSKPRAKSPRLREGPRGTRSLPSLLRRKETRARMERSSARSVLHRREAVRRRRGRGQSNSFWTSTLMNIENVRSRLLFVCILASMLEHRIFHSHQYPRCLKAMTR